MSDRRALHVDVDVANLEWVQAAIQGLRDEIRRERWLTVRALERFAVVVRERDEALASAERLRVGLERVVAFRASNIAWVADIAIDALAVLGECPRPPRRPERLSECLDQLEDLYGREDVSAPPWPTGPGSR